MIDLIFKKEAYQIIGLAMEVHRNLGKGFSEVVYKDALEHEFNNSNILYEREKKYKIKYRNIILSHYYYADFVVFDKIILEAKCVSGIVDEHINQTLNYLAVSNCKLGLIVNFSKQSLEYQRVIL